MDPAAAYRLKQLFQAMEFIGVGSLFIVLLTGLFTGAVFALQGAGAFRMFNAESLVGSTVAISLARELSPVLTGLMVHRPGGQRHRHRAGHHAGHRADRRAVHDGGQPGAVPDRAPGSSPG